MFHKQTYYTRRRHEFFAPTWFKSRQGQYGKYQAGTSSACNHQNTS